MEKDQATQLFNALLFDEETGIDHDGNISTKPHNQLFRTALLTAFPHLARNTEYWIMRDKVLVGKALAELGRALQKP